MTVYFDNAATSRFKPKGVYDAIMYDLAHSANSGRSGHADALTASLKIEECRNFLLSALGGEESHRVIFTKSCTEALNLALFGYVQGGERVLTDANEHNAVLRPLFELKRRGVIELDVLEQEQDGTVSVEKLKQRAAKADIVALGGVCNVTGASVDLKYAAKAVKDAGCTLIVDGAQCVPLTEINLQEMGIDMLACAGHKGLHGVQGTGFLAANKDLKLSPIVYGGTGTFSALTTQPTDMPEGFEAGTLPAGGIAALKAGAEWSFAHAKATRELYAQLTKTALYNLKTIGCTVYCANCDSGIVAFNLGDVDSGFVADMLNEAGVAVRSGLHCAPLVHRHFGTLSQGMVRVSFGVESTNKDVLYFSNALEKIAAKIK